MGLEIDIAWLTVLLFGSLGVLLALGLPMAFCTGSLAVIFLFVFGSPAILNMMPARIFPFMTDYQLSAVPLFIFMATMLEKAGDHRGAVRCPLQVARRGQGRSGRRYRAGLHGAGGDGRGGRCDGSDDGHDRAAGDAQARLRPETRLRLAACRRHPRDPDPTLGDGNRLCRGRPAISRRIAGRIDLPGATSLRPLCQLWLLRCYLNPQLGPALPPEERVSGREKLRLLQNTIAPILLIVLVLGIIFVGIATPVEAAGIGTFGALFVSALHRRLTWPAIEEAAIATLKATAMVMWIFFGATMFVGFFIVKGGQTFVADSILSTGPPAYGVLMLMMVILFVLGMFLDWVGILLLTVPIFLPIMKSLAWGGLLGFTGVNPEDVPLWYGVIFMVNMQMAFLSPPFGYSLFYLKTVAPPEVTMATIFRASVNFMALQWTGVGLCILFPQIITWLPSLVYTH
jgi:TRAP-type mannitol/chloroaromatic compound transport system permease large subunit